MPAWPTNLTPYGQRVLGALIAAGHDQGWLARQLGISTKTLSRALCGKREWRDREVGEIHRFAPEWFLREGFEGAGGQDRLQRIEDGLRLLLEHVGISPSLLDAASAEKPEAAEEERAARAG